METFEQLMQRQSKGGVVPRTGPMPCEHSMAASLILARGEHPGKNTAEVMRWCASRGQCSRPEKHRHNSKYPSGGHQDTVNVTKSRILQADMQFTVLPDAYASFYHDEQGAAADAAIESGQGSLMSELPSPPPS
jgi:hypothetical protein